MALKAIFLDAGGTIVHLDRPFILATLAREGVERTEEDFVAAAEAGRLRMEAILRSPEPGDDAMRWAAFASTLLDDLGCYGIARERVQQAVAARWREGRLWSYVLPGTREALDALRTQGLKLVVVSNADGRIESFLELAGLRHLLDVIVDSGVVGVEKPDPRIFEIACGMAGVEPAEAIHVGDLYEVDVLGARAAGIDAVLLDPLGTQHHAACERIVSIAELPGVVARWRNGAHANGQAAAATTGIDATHVAPAVS